MEKLNIFKNTRKHLKTVGVHCPSLDCFLLTEWRTWCTWYKWYLKSKLHIVVLIQDLSESWKENKLAANQFIVKVCQTFLIMDEAVRAIISFSLESYGICDKCYVFFLTAWGNERHIQFTRGDLSSSWP